MKSTNMKRTAQAILLLDADFNAKSCSGRPTKFNDEDSTADLEEEPSPSVCRVEQKLMFFIKLC
ncbi:hypothetical protein KIN20_005893 [Parelaphostrongylus tenuis]|uniref:Uncharacterized protein n=1 Tax=Parelaphostrongylus tenuis TaxID=148309 RepID=A0AAD5M2U3_PARTN|nr:hypothetical protein KIN20_005893 [Parelaphostrongylus tenuis]